MTASCDTCRRPGACCSGFVIAALGGFPLETWREDGLDLLAKLGNIDFFEPLHPKLSLNAPGLYMPVWRCTRLGPDGRCTDYENRPDLCHRYQAGDDELCAEFAHQFKGIPLTWGAA